MLSFVKDVRLGEVPNLGIKTEDVNVVRGSDGGGEFKKWVEAFLKKTVLPTVI